MIIPGGYTPKMTIAEAIRAERNRLGMSQEAFAAALGVPQSYVSKWESGRTKPTYGNAERIADLTQRKVGDFFDPATRRGRVKRQSIDALASGLDDDDWKILFDHAASLRRSSVQLSDAPAPDATAIGKRKRARTT